MTFPVEYVTTERRWPCDAINDKIPPSATRTLATQMSRRWQKAQKRIMMALSEHTNPKSKAVSAAIFQPKNALSEVVASVPLYQGIDADRRRLADGFPERNGEDSAMELDPLLKPTS